MNKFNLQDLFNSYKIVFLGDDHNMNQGREWLAREIKKSKLRIDFLALEYIEVDKQYLIDERDDNKLKKYLEKAFKDFPGFNAESILGIISSCHHLGVKVFGIEMPEESFSDWYKADAQRERMEFISNQVIELTALGKGIVLIGADHVEKNRNNVFRRIKESAGKNNIISLIFVGGKDWSIDTEEYWIKRLESDAKNKGLDKQFYIEPGNKQIPADWIIHFPQTEHAHILL